MAKDAVDSVDTVDSEDAKLIEEAKKTTGRTPQDIAVSIREFAKMLEAVRMSRMDEMFIGTYFIPEEGQLGIEGLVHQATELINETIRRGWQPWQMAAPYFAKRAFNLGGVRTGDLNGQWVTIIFGRAKEEL